MKKICFLIGNLNSSGGTERVTSIIANELSKQNYNVSILSLSDGRDPFFELQPAIQTYSLYSKKISFKKNFIGAVWKIRQFLKHNNIDTLIVVDSISCVFTVPALYGLNINHICWEHFNFKVDLGVPFRHIGRKIAAKCCDSVVTLTERDKQYWLQGTKHKSQVIAIANPCPFPVQEHIKEANAKIVLAVGRLTYQKGFDILLEAWIQVNEIMPEWVLKIVGEGEDRTKLTDFIRENKLTNSVELVGNTNDVSQYYKEAEIFCLSSRFEGFPMVLLETLAFGLPVVSFDCDTGPAEVLHDTGSILVPQNDISKFALSLIELMNDSERLESMSKRSKKKAAIYQPEHIVKQWIDLFENPNSL